MDRTMEPEALTHGSPAGTVVEITTAEIPTTEASASRFSERDFAAVYEAHYRDVYRYVLALTRSHADAEDTSAEAFERAYRHLASGASLAERTLPWLLLTARRIATDRWRRARRFAGLLPRLRPDAGSSGHLQTEFWLWFEALCEELPDRQREVLVLRYQRDLTDAEIGSIMGLSESGVRSLVARAIANLRDHPELLS